MRLVLLAFFVFVATPISAADPTSRRPVVAVLDPDGIDRVAVVEARLLVDGNITLVDRQALTAVLKEQELQAAFGPEGVGRRVALGRILKADVIVLIRRDEDTEKSAVDVVVCETAGGLRLIARPVPMTDNANADSSAILAVVRAGLSKYGERVREVVAVPPFVSQDLGFEYDYLKAAYSKLAEVAAADLPGVVAIELAEAEAVASELRLATPGAGVARPLPTYLLGEYRNDGVGDDRRVKLTLTAERGGNTLGKATTVTVSPSTATTAVREWATLTVAGAGDNASTPADPTVEAKRLAKLAERFRLTGDWAEAVTLIEASLLLDPKQPELHAHAVRLHAARIDRVWPTARTNPSVMTDVSHHYARRLAHLEGFFDTAEFKGWPWEVSKLVGVGQHRLLNGPIGTDYPYLPRDVVAVAKRLDESQAPLRKRIVELADQHGYWMSPIPYWEYPRVKRYAAQEQLLRDYQERYKGKDPAGNFYGLTERGSNHPDDPPGDFATEYLAFLDRVDTFAVPELKAAVARHRKDVLDEKAGYRWRVSGRAFGPPKPDALTPGTGPVRMTPIPLTRAGDAAGTPVDDIQGFLAAGPGADLLWGWGGIIYLMTEKGTLRTVWKPQDHTPTGGTVTERVTSSCFDGKFAWVVVNSDRNERVNDVPMNRHRTILLAVDPSTGTVSEVTQADGLPGLPTGADSNSWGQSTIVVAPLGPGRIAAVGVFGHRSWVATIDRTAVPGDMPVKVIYEARTLQGPRTRNWRPSLGEVFHPKLLAVLKSPKAGAAKLFIIRDSLYPLVLDPTTGKADSLPYTIWSSDYQTQGDKSIRPAVIGGDLYVSRMVLKAKPFRRIERVRYPGTKPELLAAWPHQPSDGGSSILEIVPHNDRVFVVENKSRVDKAAPATGPEVYRRPTYGRYQRWWVLDHGTKTLRLAAAETPAVLTVTASSHYGLIAVVAGEREHQGGTLAVVDTGTSTSVRTP